MRIRFVLKQCFGFSSKLQHAYYLFKRLAAHNFFYLKAEGANILRSAYSNAVNRPVAMNNATVLTTFDVPKYRLPIFQD